MSMKRFRLRTGKGQRIVGSGESHQDFHRMSLAPIKAHRVCGNFHASRFTCSTSALPAKGPTVNSTNPL